MTQGFNQEVKKNSFLIGSNGMPAMGSPPDLTFFDSKMFTNPKVKSAGRQNGSIGSKNLTSGGSLD